MRHYITRKETIQLTQYFITHVKIIHSTRLRYSVIAEYASRELGFAVTEHNIKTIATACDLDWLPITTASNPLSLLARNILNIAEECGMERDPDVFDIAWK